MISQSLYLNMEKKVNKLLERGYVFDFLSPNQIGYITDYTKKIIQVKHNSTDREINHQLEFHIKKSDELESSLYERLKTYVEGKTVKLPEVDETKVKELNEGVKRKKRKIPKVPKECRAQLHEGCERRRPETRSIHKSRKNRKRKNENVKKG